MMQKPRFTAAVALCAAALLQGAAAFQIWMSTNELPDDLNRRADEWVEAKSLVQGLIGPAAPHPTDPMPNRIDEGRVRAKFMQSFGDVPRILTQSWDQWAPTNGEGIFEKFETLGFDADEVLLWGLDDDIGPDIRMTLSTGQLDKVASSPVVDEALILVKSFGPDLKYQDQLTPSIDHPACSGVVMEASSGFWCHDPEGPRQPHLAAAKYVEESGKRLFIVPPPRDHETTPLPQQMDCMLDALFGALSTDFFCSDRLHIVAAAYGVGPLTLLPERKSDGTIAASFTGGMLTLEEKRKELCSGGDVASADPVPEPQPEPAPEVSEDVAEEAPDANNEVLDAEDGDGDDVFKGDVTHSSGLTASEMVARIRKQRRRSSRGKVLVGTRTIRRARRTRGSRRNMPVVADEVVAVDDDGVVSVSSSVGGVRIHVSSSSGGVEDVEEDDEDGGEDGEEGSSGGRSWAQCIKDCMDKCCKGMKACMDKCCEGMKKCCDDMMECMKKCCAGMKDMAMKCCEGMKKCCEGMKECMKMCCEGMKKCCDGAMDCMKKCCEGVMKACSCMKKLMFTEEDDEQEVV